MSDALFWDTIFSIDITPAEGLSNIAILVHSPSKITIARSLRGDQAQTLVDLIDRVSNSGVFSLVPRVLITKRSFSLCPTLIKSYSGGAHGCSTRSARHVGYYPPHMPSIQGSQSLVSLDGVAALQT